ncbi:adp-ribose 1 phosphate phosphatase [Fusarium acuminatum]|uniref:Adp-ribose 1 phosphate phosphatase n=1 Tax=Fusarium acuminatum TaxID=5515 RepID=A0ABZ2X8X1_9HYPO
MAAPVFALEATSLNTIRSLPSDIYLVHATNCIAEWGSGIAAELATVFPEACKEYKKFCQSAKTDASSRWPPRTLAGRSYIIPPQASGIARGAPNIHIVCLFTSYGYGRANPRSGKPGKDNARKILAQTRAALKEMREQLATEACQTSEGVTTIYSPMFNSGAFQVPWGETSKLIEDEFNGWVGGHRKRRE